VLRLAIAVGALALFLPAPAGAALSFAFDRAQARPGQVVRAFQADSGGHPIHAWADFDPASVTLYLVRLSAAELGQAPTPSALRLGPMRIDRNGVWTITFRVPKVRPGLYTTAFFCRPCGNTFFPSTLPGTPWTRNPGRVLKIAAGRSRALVSRPAMTPGQTPA
jgi:hypothetical protein